MGSQQFKTKTGSLVTIGDDEKDLAKALIASGHTAVKAKAKAESKKSESKAAAGASDDPESTPPAAA